MSISSWHLKDSNLHNRPKKSNGGMTARNVKYTQNDIDQFCNFLREGYSVSHAVRNCKVPLSKAYDILRTDKELRAIHENNKTKGFKK